MKVLLATDGGAPAEAARRLLERIGDRAHVQVTVVSVVPHPPLPSPLWQPVMAEKIAGETATRLQQVGFNADSVVAQGRPAAEIVRLAREGDFDLTVLGSGTATWLGHVLLGSVSTHVLHSSPSSVLIVHECQSMEHRLRVLVGADGSMESKLALDVFREFATPVECDAVVASVVHTDWHPAYPYPIPSADREKELEEGLMEQARAHADEGAEELRRAAFTSRPVVLVGRPPSQLLKEADNQRADLIVVGSRGYGPLGRALMGSVSDQVSRHARAALVGRRKRE